MRGSQRVHGIDDREGEKHRIACTFATIVVAMVISSFSKAFLFGKKKRPPFTARWPFVLSVINRKLAQLEDWTR